MIMNKFSFIFFFINLIYFTFFNVRNLSFFIEKMIIEKNKLNKIYICLTYFYLTYDYLYFY